MLEDKVDELQAKVDELYDRCIKLDWDKTRLEGKLERIESLIRYSDISINWFEKIMKVIEEEL